MTNTRFPIVRWTAALALAAAAACAPAPRIVFPAATPTPAPDAAATWQTTTAACRAAANYSAEIVIDGRVGTEKLGHVTLQAAMTRDGRIRMVAVAPIGGPIFVLAGVPGRATLTLPRQHRVLTVARIADVVDALIGLKFSPHDWVDVLSGCVLGALNGGGDLPFNVANGGYVGADLLMSLGPRGRALLRKNGADWRVVLAERPEAMIEYRAYQGTWPSLARISSAPTAAVPLSINLQIDQIFVNNDLPEKTFTLEVPAGFEPMTLAELRAIGPLGEKDR